MFKSVFSYGSMWIVCWLVLAVALFLISGLFVSGSEALARFLILYLGGIASPVAFILGMVHGLYKYKNP